MVYSYDGMVIDGRFSAALPPYLWGALLNSAPIAIANALPVEYMLAKDAGRLVFFKAKVDIPCGDNIVWNYRT